MLYQRSRDIEDRLNDLVRLIRTGRHSTTSVAAALGVSRPTIAMLSAADQHHERCTEGLAVLRPPRFTCWPVVTEAQWLVRHDFQGVEGRWQAFASGLLSVSPVDEGAMPWRAAFPRRDRRIEPEWAAAPTFRSPG